VGKHLGSGVRYRASFSSAIAGQSCEKLLEMNIGTSFGQFTMLDPLHTKSALDLSVLAALTSICLFRVHAPAVSVVFRGSCSGLGCEDSSSHPPAMSRLC
jgi:hypothetical protein